MFHRIGANLEDIDCVETRKRVRVMIWAAIRGDSKGPAIILKGDPDLARGRVTAERYLTCLKDYLPPMMEG